MSENQLAKLPDVVRTIVMNASIERVWEAVATSEGLAMWLMPNTFLPKLGHEFTFEAKGDYSGMIPCKVMELNAPNKLGITWANWYVSFNLVALESGQTEFTLIHSGWTEDQAMIREKMYDGWGYLTQGLKEKLGDSNEGRLN